MRTFVIVFVLAFAFSVGSIIYLSATYGYVAGIVSVILYLAAFLSGYLYLVSRQYDDY